MAWAPKRESSARRRTLLQHVILRAVFDDYLAELNGETPRSRSMSAAASGARDWE